MPDTTTDETNTEATTTEATTTEATEAAPVPVPAPTAEATAPEATVTAAATIPTPPTEAEATGQDKPAKRIRRIFMHGTMRLSDPDPSKMPQEVKAILAASYPDLANATLKLNTSKTKETETTREEVWEFERAVGTKG